MPLEHSQKQRFVVFFAEPGTADHDKLTLLDTEHDELGSGTGDKNTGEPRLTT